MFFFFFLFYSLSHFFSPSTSLFSPSSNLTFPSLFSSSAVQSRMSRILIVCKVCKFCPAHVSWVNCSGGSNRAVIFFNTYLTDFYKQKCTEVSAPLTLTFTWPTSPLFLPSAYLLPCSVPWERKKLDVQQTIVHISSHAHWQPTAICVCRFI